jgi:hypothetical protein
MAGIIIIQHQDGIGPKFVDMAKGIKEGATYISDNALDQQRRILESFVKNHLGAERWKKSCGVKFVPIQISQSGATYHITMPFGEQILSLTVGGDGISPLRLENARNKIFSNIKFCNADFWQYNDYGKNLRFYNTCGVIADFAAEGTE